MINYYIVVYAMQLKTFSLLLCLLTGVTISAAAVPFVQCDQAGCCCTTARPAESHTAPDPMGCCCAGGPEDACQIVSAAPFLAVQSFLPSAEHPETRFEVCKAPGTLSDALTHATPPAPLTAALPHFYKAPPLYLQHAALLF